MKAYHWHCFTCGGHSNKGQLKREQARRNALRHMCLKGSNSVAYCYTYHKYRQNSNEWLYE